MLKMTLNKIIAISILCILCTSCSTLETLGKRSNRLPPYTEMTNECKIFEKNDISQKPVYSGTRNAIANIWLPWGCHGEDCWLIFLYPFILPYSLIDMPLSLVADTIVLPYTSYLQFKACPNVDWDELANRRNRLSERIQTYYSDCTNPEHIWSLASSGFRRNRSKDEFIAHLRVNNITKEGGNCGVEVEEIIINGKEAEILIFDHSVSFYRIKWYDFWVYENGDWYMDRPKCKKNTWLRKY